MKNLIESINKLSLPATILIASIILGGFYYASESSKQHSIEKQQAIKIETERAAEQKKEREATLNASRKSDCVGEAEQRAVDYYKSVCSALGNCKEGRYMTSSYDNYYEQCLQKYNLK